MSCLYRYLITRGLATLKRGDDKPIKKIGKFPSDAAARLACEAHFSAAMRMAIAAGREPPTALYV